MNLKEFVQFVKTECEPYDVKIHLPKQLSVKKCNGYFEDDGGCFTLACATKKHWTKWFPVFVHEYCHFCQWREDSPYWLNFVDKHGNDVVEHIFEWLNGREFGDNIWNYIRATREGELDCERRAVKIIKKLDLPINPDLYAQRANAYVNFYNYIALRRKWYKVGKAPYENKKIVELMPRHLKGDFDKIDMKYIELVDKYCFK